jgi:MFS family permease
MSDGVTQGQPYPRFRWTMLVILCTAGISGTFANGGYAPILGVIAKNLNVPLGAATQLLTIAIFVMSAITIFAGHVCDRLGIAFTMCAGIILCVIPESLLPWIGNSYGNVFIVRMLGGLSMGLTGIIIAPCLAQWFPLKERGTAGAILSSTVGLGSAISVAASPAILRSVGSWQVTIALMTIPLWASLAIMLTLGRRQPPAQALVNPMAEGGGAGSVAFKTMLAAPITWIGCLLFVFMAWIMMSLHSIVPPFLAVAPPAGLGYGPMMAGKISGLFFVGGLVAPLLGGVFLDKVAKGDSRHGLFIGYAVTGIGLFLALQPPFYRSIPLLTTFLVFAGLGVGFTAPSMIVYITGRYPVHMVGKIMGLWAGVGGFGGAAGVFLGGVAVSKFGGYSSALVIIPLICIAGCALSFCFRPLRAKRQEGAADPVAALVWEGNSKAMYDAMVAGAPGPAKNHVRTGFEDWVVKKGIKVLTEDLFLDHIKETFPPEFAPMILEQVMPLKSK